jgi:hypothetical protein
MANGINRKTPSRRVEEENKARSPAIKEMTPKAPAEVTCFW